MIEDMAVCVRTWDWSETSQTAVMITRSHGLVRVLAKGSRRERAPFSGGLEIATRGELAVLARQSSDLSLITRWDLTHPMLGLRRDLDTYNTAMLAIDLVPRMIQDHDPHPEIHDALSDLLETCDDPASSRAPRIAHLLTYLWILLDAVGARPLLDHDADTGHPLDEASMYAFAPHLGGVTADSSSDNPNDPRWRVRASTVKILRTLDHSPQADTLSDLPTHDLTRASALLASYIRERIGSDIPSMSWLLKNTQSDSPNRPPR